MIEQIKIKFLYMFCIISGDMLSFLSGIFVATAINILTCRLPDSVLVIGKIYLFIAIVFLGVAFILIKWSIYVKPIHETYFASSVAIEDLGKEQCWHNLVEGEKAKALVSYFIVIVVLSLISFTILIFPNMSENIRNLIVKVLYK